MVSIPPPRAWNGTVSINFGPFVIDDVFNPLSAALRLAGGYGDAIARQLVVVGLAQQHADSLAREIAAQCKVFLNLNPRYESGNSCFKEWFANNGLNSALSDPGRFDIPSLYTHQEKAIVAIREGRHTLITAGTGSGKTECFTIPIIDWCLNHNAGAGGIQAILIYPMNALAG